jgi:hypothetical protein
MKSPFTVRRAWLAATACMLFQHGGVAIAGMSSDDDSAPTAGARTSFGSMTPEPVASALQRTVLVPGASAALTNGGEAQGNVAELLRLIHDQRLKELRTTYNGSYGASLFFDPQQISYYVALFQDKHFWRVIKTTDMNRAESVYRGFAEQTAQLADVEIRRLQLQAQKAYIDDTIAMSEDRARRLQADLEIARAQQVKVADYQRQSQDETAALRLEKDKAQAQLRQVQSQVLQLQQMNDSGLPNMVVPMSR